MKTGIQRALAILFFAVGLFVPLPVALPQNPELSNKAESSSGNDGLSAGDKSALFHEEYLLRHDKTLNVNNMKSLWRELFAEEMPAIKLIDEAPRARSKLRPLYIIAHQCNDVAKVEEALKLGANAIECDVRYVKNRWIVSHDALSQFFSGAVTLDDWLNGVAPLSIRYRTRLAMILFDIKDPDEVDAIVTLHQQARAKLPFRTMALLFSTARFDNRKAFDKLKDKLGKHDGVAIDDHNDPVEVTKYFREKLQVENFWFGNGVTSRVSEKPFAPNVERSIRHAVKLRDAGELSKVFVWTFAKRSGIEKYLKVHQVDGIIVEPGAIDAAVGIAGKQGRLAKLGDHAFSAHEP